MNNNYMCVQRFYHDFKNSKIKRNKTFITADLSWNFNKIALEDS